VRAPAAAPTRGRWLGILLVALALGACATVPPRQPIPPAAQAAREALERRWQAFTDLRTRADVTIRRGERRDRLAGVLLVRAPASLRFEALSPFGLPVLVVTADRETVTIWDVLKNRAWLLPASPEANRRWLGVALGSRDLAALLTGHVLPLEDPLAAELLPPDAVGPSLRLTGAQGAQRIWLDPASGQTFRAEWTGKAPARAAFEGGSATEPPTGLTLATEDGALEVRLRYHDLRLDAGLDPVLLRITVPEHVKIQDFR
jgi:outer membrane lipoprotein-sorting protein